MLDTEVGIGNPATRLAGVFATDRLCLATRSS